MNKKLQQTLDSALERTRTTRYAPVTINALRTRLTEELDWLDADPGRECMIILLQELAAKMRSARIVVSPGYSFLHDSCLLFLTGVTRVNPVEWDLPFSCFTKSVGNKPTIPFEVGSGGLEVARKVLSGRENEMVTETEPGIFEISFLDGVELMGATLRFLCDTYGIPIYQEQYMLLSMKLASFNKTEADLLRRAFGKRQKSILLTLKDKFLSGGAANGLPSDALEKIWNEWEQYCSNSIIRAHSSCYVWLSYLTAWLKCHYTSEFYLSSIMNSKWPENTQALIADCSEHGIEVIKPDVNS